MLLFYFKSSIGYSKNGKVKDLNVRHWGKLLYYRRNLRCDMQGVREISAIILNDNYLSYKEPKSPYSFFLISIFNELFSFKT